MFSNVNQFHSGTAVGDAITGDMLEMRRVLRAAGLQSEIYAEHVAPGLEDEIRSISEYAGDSKSLLIVHHSFGFGLFNKIISLPDRKILRYHNITPMEFMDRDLAQWSEQGREQLRDYVPHMEVAIGDSEYNRSELIDCGFRYTCAIPIFFRPPALLHETPDSVTRANIHGTFNLLFVGRIAVNKRQDELVAIFSEYFHRYNRDSRLFLVGKADGNQMTEQYTESIRSKILQHNLRDAAVVTGKVSSAQLAAYYRGSQVLLCASEHEGFCVPLLEAMAFDLPIIAFSAAAVPETLGGSGILLEKKDPVLWSEVIEQLRLDDDFRETVVNSQRKRLEQLSVESSGSKLLDIVNGLATGVPLRNDRPTLQIQGPFESSYSLAGVNRNLAIALDEEETFDTSIYCTEGPGDYSPDMEQLKDKPYARWLWHKSRMLNGKPDIAIRNLYPPRVHDIKAAVNFAYIAWEDSLLPRDWAVNFNQYLDAMLAPSCHVERVLKDSGVSIPIFLLPEGIDETFFRRPTPKGDQILTFLNISSGFPRKGIDILLEAYFTEFSASDAVRLIIKTFPNIHNEVAQQLENWRHSTSNPPLVEHIDQELTAEDLVRLYSGASCFVYPTRCEGFGLPIAEAMAMQCPVIVTAYSGHMDFCNEENSFLIEYDLAPSKSHLSVPGSQWAEPKVESLRKHMRFLTGNRNSESVRNKIAVAYENIKTNYRWSVAARRCVDEIGRALREKQQSLRRIVVVSSWDSRCGIAEYTRYLIESVLAKRSNWHFEVISSPTEGVWSSSPVPQKIGWRHRDWRLKLGLKQLFDSDVDAVHFQFNFAFFELPDLADTIRALKDHGKRVLITFHSTANVNENGVVRSLQTIAEELRSCDAILVHSADDKRRLASFGITEKVEMIPHGNVVFPVEDSAENLRRSLGLRFTPAIGTFGFLLPHKGLRELVEATHLLQTEYPNIALMGQCARHTVGLFSAYENSVKGRISELGMEDHVLLSTDFVEPAEAALMLQMCDVIVLPYNSNAESSSAAVRFALAAGRPVITTAQPIFQDVVDITYQIPSSDPREIASAIRTVLEDPVLHKSLASKARAHAEARSWDQVGTKYLAILEDIFADGSGGDRSRLGCSAVPAQGKESENEDAVRSQMTGTSRLS